MRRLLVIVVALSAAIGAVSFAGATGPPTADTAAAGPITRTFFTIADTRVEEAKPGINFGGLPKLRVAGGAALDKESFLRFRVTDVSGPIESARLWIRTATGSGDGTADGPAIYGTSTSWSETGTNWNNRPGLVTAPADDKGAIAADRWVGYNVKPLLEGNGTYAFALATGSADEVAFNSREATSNKPRMIVKFRDAQAPTAPSGLTARPLDSTRVRLTWGASSDNIGVTGYKVLRDGVLLARVGPETTHVDRTVVAGGRYSYRVVALDAAENESAPSQVASVIVPTTLTFGAEADATIEQAQPSSNFGSGTRLRAVGGNGSLVKSLLRFRVSGVTGPVRSAQLFVRTGSAAPAATVNGPGIHATQTAWSEKTVTWANRPTATSMPVDDHGPIAAATWAAYDVKSLVDGNGVYSFALGTNAIDNVAFHSREATLAKPRLVVRFVSQQQLVMAAGDIACDPGDSGFNGGLGTATQCAQLHTSNLIRDANPHAVLPLGDLQYSDATLSEFMGSYDPSWGRFKSRTHPAPGNHEYKTSGASGYYDYFNGPGNPTGRAGDRTKGYYSFNLGAWHLIALNSECSEVGGCGPGSPQEQWLRADLQANPRECTLAYWHHPRFSSGNHGNSESVQGLWQALWQAGADIVLSGHSHDYERFAPQNAAGAHDPRHGIREFVVGTGGKDLTAFETIRPNSEVREASTFGVLALSLRTDSYSWQFRPVPGSTFTDSGSGSCHGPPPAAPAP